MPRGLRFVLFVFVMPTCSLVVASQIEDRRWAIVVAFCLGVLTSVTDDVLRFIERKRR